MVMGLRLAFRAAGAPLLILDTTKWGCLTNCVHTTNCGHTTNYRQTTYCGQITNCVIATTCSKTARAYILGKLKRSYRAYALTYLAAVQICWNKGECLYKKRVELPQGWLR